MATALTTKRPVSRVCASTPRYTSAPSSLSMSSSVESMSRFLLCGFFFVEGVPHAFGDGTLAVVALLDIHVAAHPRAPREHGQVGEDGAHVHQRPEGGHTAF